MFNKAINDIYVLLLNDDLIKIQFGSEINFWIFLLKWLHFFVWWKENSDVLYSTSTLRAYIVWEIPVQGLWYFFEFPVFTIEILLKINKYSGHNQLNY